MGPVKIFHDGPETSLMTGCAVTGECVHNMSPQSAGPQRRALCFDRAARGLSLRFIHYASLAASWGSTPAWVQIIRRRTKRGGGRAECCHGDSRDRSHVLMKHRCLHQSCWVAKQHQCSEEAESLNTEN